MKNYAILRIESFEGDDTFIRCGNDDQDFLYAVVLIDERGHVDIIDNGYRSYAEAAATWPEAAKTKTTQKSKGR